ncbi:MAG: TonB-dependent receptor [Hyphomonadaceae bacterium]|nr:TonB-dependent receptor [Hyphomonadaceae bacterium]
MTSNLKSSVSLLAVSLFIATPAFAQAEDTDADTARRLGSVLVTAEKQEESAQDLGLVVAAFEGDTLKDSGVDDVDDLVTLLPNVQLLEATGGGVPIVFIRGVGLADFRVNNSPAAAFYVDEVYQPSVATIGSTFFDLERIEVLKGPQGGLYGRNTTAGAFQIISAAPSLDGAEGYLTAGVGEFSRVELEGAFNTPITDTLALRVAGRTVKSGDTYMTSVQDVALPEQRYVSGGDGHGEEDQWALRAQLLFQPSDIFDATLKLYTGSDQSETTLVRPIGFWAPGDADGDRYADAAFTNTVCAPLLAGVRDDTQCVTITGETVGELGFRDEYDTASSNLNRLDNEWFGGSLIANWKVSDRITLTSITGYEDFDHARPTDWDGIDVAYQDIDYFSELSAFSQEFRFSYEGDGWDFLGGVKYASEELSEDTVVFGAAGLIPIAFGFEEVVQRYEQEVEALAVFGRVDWDLTDRLSAVGELRYTQEDKSFTGATTLRSPVGSTDRVTEFPFVNPTQPDASFDDFSGKVALEFDVTETVLTYASLSRGFKSGGYPGGVVLSSAGATAYDPETITAYEVGVKSDLMDQRLRANVSVFFYDYTDLQGSARVPAPGGVTLDRFQNIGDAEVYGLDAEFSFLATENLLFQAMIGLAEGEITESQATQLSPLTRDVFSLVGQELNYKPDASANLLGRYDFDVSDTLGAYVQLAYDWRSDQNFAFIGIPAERALFVEEGYGLINFQAGLAPNEGDWRVSAFVRNLTDERYRTNARTDALGGAFEIYGAPRVWGFTATKEF